VRLSVVARVKNQVGDVGHAVKFIVVILGTRRAATVEVWFFVEE